MFSVILNAHYQSSPNDLNLLLSDPLHRLAYTRQNGESLLSPGLFRKGPVQKSCIPIFYRVNDALKVTCYHKLLAIFYSNPGRLARWLRVARIAVPEHERHQGYASELLDFIRNIPSTRISTKQVLALRGSPALPVSGKPMVLCLGASVIVSTVYLRAPPPFMSKQPPATHASLLTIFIGGQR